MRERIFKIILNGLEKHRTVLFQRLELQSLLVATARGFEQRGKCILFKKDPLAEYAAFTAFCMQKKADRKRLFRVMYRLGRGLRKITGLTDPEDLKRLVFLLYRNIGITMTGKLPGEIEVSECYFSHIYTAEECRFISAMDYGIIAGICGAGSFHFTKRITEGCGYCQACFVRQQYMDKQ